MAPAIVIEYGVGNIASIANALRYLSLPFNVSADPADLAEASFAILPGVGNFGAGMAELRRRGFEQAIRNFVARDGTRLLGICLGMHLLFDSSEEAPDERGLSLLPGAIVKLPHADGAAVPHVGFDSIRFDRPAPLIAGLEDGTDFYFTHSYALMASPPDTWFARCRHGNNHFIAAVDTGRVAGVQFHPEKSQSNGLALLRNVVNQGTTP